MQWIKTSERLPEIWKHEKNKEVLISTGENFVVACLFKNANGSLLFTDHESFYIPVEKIKYWCEITPPTEEP